MSSFVEFRSAVSKEKSKISRPIRGKGGNLVFFSDQPEKKTKTYQRTLRSCLLLCFVVFRSAVSEKSKMFQTRWPSFFFLIDPKNTNLVDDDLASCQVS